MVNTILFAKIYDFCVCCLYRKDNKHKVHYDKSLLFLFVLFSFLST